MAIGDLQFGSFFDFHINPTQDSVNEEIKVETRLADQVREGDYVYIQGEPCRVK